VEDFFKTTARTPKFLIGFGVIILLVILWWFLIMSPEASKLHKLHETSVTLEAQRSSLKAQLDQLKSEKKLVPKDFSVLKFDKVAVPDRRDEIPLITSIDKLASATGVTVSSFSLGTPNNAPSGPNAKSASPGTVEALPLSLTVNGGYGGVLVFVNDLYNLKRLIVIDSFSLSGKTNGTNAKYSVNLSCTTYMETPTHTT
jgi:Tfp pilus assembly protein PilO